MAVTIRELAAPLTAREWLQNFWQATGRLPYRYEIPQAFYKWFPSRRVPMGWRAELGLMQGLRRLGLRPTWSPGADAAGVDVGFILGSVRVRMQLKVRREAQAVTYKILCRSAHAADLFVVIPAAAVDRLPNLTPRLVAAIRTRLLA